MKVACYIPTADVDWVLQQNPGTRALFLDCWHSDPYGSEWETLDTKLKKTGLLKAMANLAGQGLFDFKQEDEQWFVRNRHGSTVVEFWVVEMDNPPRAAPEQIVTNSQTV